MKGAGWLAGGRGGVCAGRKRKEVRDRSHGNWDATRQIWGSL